MIGPIYMQDMNVNGDDRYIVPNVSTAVVDIGNQTLPNGNMIDLELGSFSIGAEDQQQVFTTGSLNVSDASVNAWIMPGYYYNTSVTKSYSFSLHIGSTAFDYPGSMYFGGYDKGRAIGPGTSWGDSNPPLQDIVLGVETGGSPFPYSSKKGLLISNTSTAEPISVYPEPLVPYLHLPKQTCDRIAKELPVTMDSTGYYLWDTSDPSYNKITTGAAYLGFVFPPGAGDTDDVTIRVPFQLLVLNLTTEASGRPGTTPYFPCMPYDTTDGNYILGRAFLQAAFFGRNWNNKVWWLAQAPGPGSSKAGLGLSPMDIEDSDTSLDFFPDEGRFADSWSQYWTPLKDDSTDGGAGSSNNGDGNSSLSTGAKAGIGVGTAAVGVALLAVLAWFITRRRRNNSKDSGSEQQPFTAAHYGDESKHAPQQWHQPQQQGGYSPYEQPQPQYPGEGHQQHLVHENYAPYKEGSGGAFEMNELSATMRNPALELPGHVPQELEAPYKQERNR